ncbi:unnamed protein product [Polarella glacialis]|uniref:Uncharacterized protein n=1 Tax=Polarella glacialis TaxID=89957 RepID=A0A813GUD4_POLGL|nr:unnamed protein product [Polarella glacialis]
MAQNWAAREFESKLQEALQRVRLVLDETKQPQPAAEVHHTYQDKYLLVEYLTNSAAASQLNCLAALGLSPEQLSTLRQWSTIPTPKEFKDAIESLSPEQQSFAKAFRAMQLESTLFGILASAITADHA